MIDLSEGSSRNRSTISSSPITVQCDLARRAAPWSSGKADDASVRSVTHTYRNKPLESNDQRAPGPSYIPLHHFPSSATFPHFFGWWGL